MDIVGPTSYNVWSRNSYFEMKILKSDSWTYTYAIILYYTLKIAETQNQQNLRAATIS